MSHTNPIQHVQGTCVDDMRQDFGNTSLKDRSLQSKTENNARSLESKATPGLADRPVPQKSDRSQLSTTMDKTSGTDKHSKGHPSTEYNVSYSTTHSKGGMSSRSTEHRLLPAEHQPHQQQQKVSYQTPTFTTSIASTSTEQRLLLKGHNVTNPYLSKSTSAKTSLPEITEPRPSRRSPFNIFSNKKGKEKGKGKKENENKPNKYPWK